MENREMGRIQNRELRTGNGRGRKRDICGRTFAFALRVVKLCKHLNEQSVVDRALVNQLIRAGTSIGANVEEAQSAQSRADFLSKISIACKEARETLYWLRLISASEQSITDDMASIVRQADELIAILTTIINNTKENINAS